MSDTNHQDANPKQLALKLFSKDGFSFTEIAEYLGKNTEFSKETAREFLKHYTFQGETVDVALRKFLKSFSFKGETQEKARIIAAFSRRYFEQNLESQFATPDSVEGLTFSLVLLNTDLHNANVERKMSLNAFIRNCSGLNNGADFPQDMLKHLYNSIKSEEIEMPDDELQLAKEKLEKNHQQNTEKSRKSWFFSHRKSDIPSAFLVVDETHGNENAKPLETLSPSTKESIVEKKNDMESDTKKSSERSWKPYRMVLRGPNLYFYKPDVQITPSTQPEESFTITHAYALPAKDYSKRQHVLHLTNHHYATFLIQCSNDSEMLEWVGEINKGSASLSSPPLSAPVGSQMVFRRPLQPTAVTKFSSSEQYEFFKARLESLTQEVKEHNATMKEEAEADDKRRKQNWHKKSEFLQYELERYRLYSRILQKQAGISPTAGRKMTAVGKRANLGANSPQSTDSHSSNSSASSPLAAAITVSSPVNAANRTSVHYVPRALVPIEDDSTVHPDHASDSNSNGNNFVDTLTNSTNDISDDKDHKNDDYSKSDKMSDSVSEKSGLTANDADSPSLSFGKSLEDLVNSEIEKCNIKQDVKNGEEYDKEDNKDEADEDDEDEPMKRKSIVGSESSLNASHQSLDNVSSSSNKNEKDDEDEDIKMERVSHVGSLRISMRSSSYLEALNETGI